MWNSCECYYIHVAGGLSRNNLGKAALFWCSSFAHPQTSGENAGILKRTGWLSFKHRSQFFGFVTTVASKELSFLETGWLLALKWLLVLGFISSIASSVRYRSLRNVFISSQVGMSDLDERCSHKERVSFGNLLVHRNTRRQSQFFVEMLEWASAIKHPWIVLCRSFRARFRTYGTQIKKEFELAIY